jgi:hypothetical protein
MDQTSDEVWRWSSAFCKAVARRRYGRRERERRRQLLWWQIEAARCLYRVGHSEPLRVLYGYWRSAAGADVREQVSFALQDITTSRWLLVRAIGAFSVQ